MVCTDPPSKLLKTKDEEVENGIINLAEDSPVKQTSETSPEEDVTSTVAVNTAPSVETQAIEQEEVPNTDNETVDSAAPPGVPMGVPQPAAQALPVPASPVATPSPQTPVGVPSEQAVGVPQAPVSVPVKSVEPTAQVLTGIPAESMVQPTVANPNALIEEKGEVSTHFVGRVIGKGGEMIRDLQARSGCRIDVDQDVPAGAPRIITYRGNRKTINFAKQLVQILCTENGKEADLPLGEARRKQLIVPANVIGKIIGRGGEMIRELQSKSQAKIQVDHSGAGGIDANMRQVTLTGTDISVLKADEMINFLIANPAMDAMAAIAMLIRDKTSAGATWGSGSPYPNMPNNGVGMQGRDGYGNGTMGAPVNQGNSYDGHNGQQQQSNGYGYGMENEIFPCAKMYMGRVIGQKGVTINDLQKRSGCDIQINQDVQPGHDCEITIKGPRQGVESAKQMLTDIIQMGPNHPYAGGGGNGGGGGGIGGGGIGGGGGGGIGGGLGGGGNIGKILFSF